MTLWELIHRTRDRYVNGFRQVLRQQRPRVADLVAEPLMRTEVLQGVPVDFCVLRVDMLWRPPPVAQQEAAQAAGESKTPVDPLRTPQVAAIGFGPPPLLPTPLRTDYPDGQTVIIHALSWEDCYMAVSPPWTTSQLSSGQGSGDGGEPNASIAPADAALIAWLRRWRDRSDSPDASPDADGICSAAHSMTPPQLQDGRIQFSVDFGTAPAEAFTALVATLFKQGAQTIEVGSPPPAQGQATVNLV